MSTRSLIIVPVTGIALLVIAGCGSSPATTSGNQASGTPAANSGARAAYRYAACMRDHGVSDFPAPQVHVSPGRVAIQQVVKSSFVNSPQFRTAQKACRSIMPGPGNQSPAQLAQQQRARERLALAFARCLRAHGLTGFPDPTPQGQLTPQMVTAAGIDLHAPQVLTAARACVGATHGAVTMAKVESFINGTS